MHVYECHVCSRLLIHQFCCGCIIHEPNGGAGAGRCCAVIALQGLQQWAQHPSLRDPCAECRNSEIRPSLMDRGPSVKRSQFVYSDDVTHPEGGVCCTGKDAVKMEIHNYESGFQVYNTE